MRRTMLSALLLSSLMAAAIGSVPNAVGATTGEIVINAPTSVTRDLLTSVRVSLPGTVAAVDGRVLMARGTATLMGVALAGEGTGLRPVPFAGGASFGAYGLRSVGGRTVIDLVLLPRQAGPFEVRVVIDATSDASGQRLSLVGRERVTMLGADGSAPARLAPRAVTALTPVRGASRARELVPDGRFDQRDLDAARAGWELARLKGHVCAVREHADVNADGCSDIVDVETTLAALGRGTSSGLGRASAVGPRVASGTGHVFTVVSTADTPDAVHGDGRCADSQGRCTLRAAMTEADYLPGDDRIDFHLPGAAPVTIQLASRLPIIASRAGTLTIDGYTQPGSRVNTAAVGSSAIPGVELRGNGNGAREVGIYITSPGNTIRGLVLQNLYRGVMLDGVDAHDNRIVGDWIGFTRTGANPSQTGAMGILINTGANHDRVGTSARADRNVIGNVDKGIDEYGPGTDRNIIQGDLFCIRPSAFVAATCATAIDHDFGPKYDVVGGDGPGERNVIGPTTLQGIEYSHGWDPSLPWGTDTKTTYQVNGNTVTGNWIGFRGDGSYDPGFRSGLDSSDADNGQAVNVYDGANDNIIQRNYVATVYDGIQVMAPNAHGNIVRGNVIGRSPLGEAAPFRGWGIKLRWGTKHDVVSGNTIRNAGSGGIGLVTTNNRGGAISPAYNIRISRNIVTYTPGLAIYLAHVATDPSAGANMLVPAPRVTDATTARVRGSALQGATVEVYRASRVSGANGLPVAFLGVTVTASDGTWSVSGSTLKAGDRVTALQIRPDDNTSELSANVTVTP